MKTKKNNTSISTEKGLAALTEIHKAMEALDEQMSYAIEMEDLPAFNRANAEFTRLSSKFGNILSQLPPVKFDDRDGTYFIGKDGTTGNEVYRVRVSSTYEGYVDIPAENEEAARLAAKDIYGKHGIEMHGIGDQPTVQVVGVPVEQEV